MSYILDALRKSEQERQRGKVPDIHGAVSDAPEPKGKSNIWPVVTLVVIVLNVGILGYFWFSFSDGSSPSGTPMPPTHTPTQASSAPAVLPPKAESLASSQVARTPKPDPRPAERSSSVSAPTASMTGPPFEPESTFERAVEQLPPAESNPALPKVGYLPQLEELPAYERDGIPDMTFSSHMYSSMPRFRSIIINGKRLKEGQYLNEEIQVREITEAGVIMSYGSTLFEVDVLGRWAQ